MKPVSMATPRGRIFGLYHPADRAKIVVVMCPPFAEEKKTSYRVLHEQAESLAASGVPVLRFDYSGTGDSEGAFEDCTVDRWLADIAAASEAARAEAGTERLCLLGLRFGASLAACCRSDRLVLWQPLMDLRAHLRANMKKQALRQKLIGGGQNHPRGEIDGYVVTGALSQSIERLRVEIVHGDCLLVQVSYDEKILPEYSRYGDREGVELRTVRLEPFWNRLGRVDARALIELTTAWVSGC